MTSEPSELASERQVLEGDWRALEIQSLDESFEDLQSPHLFFLCPWDQRNVNEDTSGTLQPSVQLSRSGQGQKAHYRSDCRVDFL
ncbi:unnamed protein product [Chondrus crispus]|uniref:Uncharacterized protein n=1 Tax=Chondrus crispus TaxID=2769 RepID=R7Q5X2_CHOCR|nr:unnamed protein product [Chondrus crispus]CDF32865.1 unnamed protein product [Chondrus crispus]|eukprot:XP_005712666.1 unnamed protein product [Chondrus crispus]